MSHSCWALDWLVILLTEAAGAGGQSGVTLEPSASGGNRFENSEKESEDKSNEDVVIPEEEEKVALEKDLEQMNNEEKVDGGTQAKT